MGIGHGGGCLVVLLRKFLDRKSCVPDDGVTYALGFLAEFS